MKTRTLLAVIITVLVLTFSDNGLITEKRQPALSPVQSGRQVFMEEIIYECEFIPEFPMDCIMLVSVPDGKEGIIKTIEPVG